MLREHRLSRRENRCVVEGSLSAGHAAGPTGSSLHTLAFAVRCTGRIPLITAELPAYQSFDCVRQFAFANRHTSLRMTELDGSRTTDVFRYPLPRFPRPQRTADVLGSLFLTHCFEHGAFDLYRFCLHP